MCKEGKGKIFHSNILLLFPLILFVKLHNMVKSWPYDSQVRGHIAVH